MFVCKPEQLLWTRANPRSKLASGILNKKCSDNRSKLRTILPFLPTSLLIIDIVILGATSVHVTKHLYEERLRDLVYMKSIYMK